MSARACIFGCAGKRLNRDEKRFFAEAAPWGFILFARNLHSEDQVRALCEDLRSCVGNHAPVLIDEEGGRVSRLRTIGGRIGPPAAVFAQSGLSFEDQCTAVKANYAAIGARLAALGIDVDCAPVVDLPSPRADPVIGNRAFSTDPALAGTLGKACLDGLNAAGISGVIKHIPGHGRAGVDSHKALPVVDADREQLECHDFLPFTVLKNAPMAMTGHVIYSAYDRQKAATCSKTVIERVIRGRIGFDGLLMSDDLDMKALQGTLAERADAALVAGCDVVLQCNGVLGDMRQIAGVAPVLAGRALGRAKAARDRASPMAIDVQKAEAVANAWQVRIAGGAI